MFWADRIAKKIKKLKPNKEILIATGISLSAPVHIGHAREFLSADIVRIALSMAGISSKIVAVVDDMDPLRKVYPFLPKEYGAYVGRPLYRILDPWNCCENYAEHFLGKFQKAMKELRVDLTIVYSSKLYRYEKYATLAKQALDHKSVIEKILQRLSGKKIRKDWWPFMAECPNCHSITNTTIVERVDDFLLRIYCHSCNFKGDINVTEGGGKFTWRIDWPMRWKILNVDVELFGRDHATKGGSYDTGCEIARKIFGSDPPFPIPYEWVHLKGYGEMHSSSGLAIPLDEVVQVIHPDIVKYFIASSLPSKVIKFHPIETVVEATEKFREAREANNRAYQIAIEGSKESKKIYQIPFTHLVTIGQLAEFNAERAEKIIKRNPQYRNVNITRTLAEELHLLKRWLEKFAFSKYGFSIHPQGAYKPTETERNFLRQLAEELIKINWDSRLIHEVIYLASKNVQIKPKEAFRLLYQIFFGNSSGPRLGWFLESLGKEEVKKLIQRVINQKGPVSRGPFFFLLIFLKNNLK